MTISRTTAAILMQSHVAYTTEETPRPLPYRTRRRRAGWIRIAAALVLAGLFAATYY